MKVAPTPESPEKDHQLAEWTEARSIVSKMDDTISGLRKYGFSFITALLAADSILGQPAAMASYSISPPVKFAVLLSTLVLVYALYATDRFYRIIQTGASYDAERVESKLEMGLTWTIGRTYSGLGARYFVELIYGLFAFATAVLGYLILNASDFAWGIVLGSVVAVVLIVVMELWASAAELRMKKAINLDSIRKGTEARFRQS